MNVGRRSSSELTMVENGGPHVGAQEGQAPLRQVYDTGATAH